MGHPAVLGRGGPSPPIVAATRRPGKTSLRPLHWTAVVPAAHESRPAGTAAVQENREIRPFSATLAIADRTAGVYDATVNLHPRPMTAVLSGNGGRRPMAIPQQTVA